MQPRTGTIPTPQRSQKGLKQFQRVFVSKADVKARWAQLLATDSGEGGRTAIGLPRDVKFAFAPGNGWRYTISLARPSDGAALASLSNEFVQTHQALFSEYGDVEAEAWSRYLGLPTEAARSQARAVSNGAKSPGQTARLSVHAFKDGGCVLKCEAVREERLQSPPPPAPQAGASRRVVGYVHFTFEEGAKDGDGGPRLSKRLKRKRGERTGEYTKVCHLVVAAAHRGLGLAQAMLAAMLECVRALEPAYGRELFLTAMQRNAGAVTLYERLGLRVFGENVTYLARAPGETSRPIVWYQLGLCADDASSDSGSSTPHSAQDGAPRKLRRVASS